MSAAHPSPIKRFLRFGAIGASAVGLNLGLFAVLVHGLNWPYLVATATIFVLTNLYGFALNRRWVFVRGDRAYGRLARYYLTMTLSLAINLGCMSVFVGQLGLPVLLASLLTSGLLAPLTFVAHGRFTFRANESLAAATEHPA